MTRSEGTYVAFIRGINVGGAHTVPMKWLAAELEGIGLRRVRTYIQSGNVIFRSGHADARGLADRIGRTIEAGRGFRTRVLVMSWRDLQAAAEANPFVEAEDDPRSLHLYFLESEPRRPDLGALDAVRSDREHYRLEGRVFYLHAPDGIARSRLAQRVGEALGVAATARNWRTVTRVLGIALALRDGQ